jgi:hypothetical protein
MPRVGDGGRESSVLHHQPGANSRQPPPEIKRIQLVTEVLYPSNPIGVRGLDDLRQRMRQFRHVSTPHGHSAGDPGERRSPAEVVNRSTQSE